MRGGVDTFPLPLYSGERVGVRGLLPVFVRRRSATKPLTPALSLSTGERGCSTRRFAVDDVLEDLRFDKQPRLGGRTRRRRRGRRRLGGRRGQAQGLVQAAPDERQVDGVGPAVAVEEIGRASCRERV